MAGRFIGPQPKEFYEDVERAKAALPIPIPPKPERVGFCAFMSHFASNKEFKHQPLRTVNVGPNGEFEV